MKKKIILTSIFCLAFSLGVIGLSAFEAHIINVTATLENALTVDTRPINFGTVFPQEERDRTFDIVLSQSFLNTDRVDDVEYMIRQKPKCWSEIAQDFGRVSEDEDGNFVCDQAEEAQDYTELPLLCPFLSKHEISTDGIVGENDSDGINAFHGPIENWTMQNTLETQVTGRLAKSEGDIQDTWNIDFRVPCFGGQCAQDWEEFVFDNNPEANAFDYILPGDLENDLFGCDLWVEVTGVSTSSDEILINCLEDDRDFDGICDEVDTCIDLDRDGYGQGQDCDGSDCNDSNPDSYRVGDYFYDSDQDGYHNWGPPNYNQDDTVSICYGDTIPENYRSTTAGRDCDDTNSNVNPNETEVCGNGIDDNCDGQVDENCGTSAPTQANVSFVDMSANPQFGSLHDYSGANASLSYYENQDGTFSTNLSATGLKPYATYQIKFEGKPTCAVGVGGNDQANEDIGYLGRWWDNFTSSNTNDAGYLANSDYHGGTHCIVGYLVWDFVTADASGNASKTLVADNSYHVLWCNGGTCDVNSNSQLQNTDGSIVPPGFPYCAADDVAGEIERAGCGTLALPSGTYDLKVYLTEESFHQYSFGNWTSVMDGDITFTIN